MKRIFLVLVVLATFVNADSLSIEAGAQFMKPGGKFQYGNGATDIKVRDDLDMDDYETSFKPQITYETGNHQVFANYQYFDGKSTSDINKNITFAGKVYTVGASTKSEIDYQWTTAGYRYKFVNVPGVYVFAAGVDLNYIDLKVEMDNALQNNKYSKEQFGPGAGLDAAFYIYKSLHVDARIAMQPFGDRSYENYYGGLKWDCLLLDGAYVRAGYEYKHLKMETSSFDGDLNFQGPYVGVGYAFKF